jgi:3-oxoacyl-[acyl-carrier-protein] synthase II
LRGVNSTIASGRVGFLGALRYASNVLSRGYADAMLVGTVEEFTPHTAWTHDRLDRAGLPGEAAVFFVLAPDTGAPHGHPRLRAVVSGFQPSGAGAALSTALAACIRRALDRAGVDPGQVELLAVGELSDPGAADIEDAAAAEVFAGTPVRRIRVRDALGDCGAANGALHLAAMLGRPPAVDGTPSTGISVLASWSLDGAVAAAVVEGGAGVRADRG